MGGFRWHPSARLFGPDGAEQRWVSLGDAVLEERPGPLALAGAMARAEAGLCFRIGAPGLPIAERGARAPSPFRRLPPEYLGQDEAGGWFETLTSGSLGVPRRIVRSQASWAASFAVNAGLFGIGPGGRVAVPGGLASSLALYGAVEGLCLGAEVHLLDGLRPDRQRAALAARGVAVVYATPAQLRLMVEAGGPVLGLRRIVVGGAKLDGGLRAALREMAPGAVVTEFYGAAEASFIAVADEATPEGSVGRAYPGVEIEAPEGEPGEIWLRSPYVFAGYGGEVGGARWRDGWLSVGEWGALRDGYLWLAGRAGRMVTVADANVFPEEIEGFLMGLPGVRRAAVLARPDGLRGSVLVAVLMGDATREAEVLRAVRAELGATKAPRRVVWVEDWPELASGKTDLRALEAWA